MPVRRRRRLAAALPLALGLLAAYAPGAPGHAALEAASPAPGGRVESAPERVVLVFTEPLNRRLTGAELRDAGGARVTVEAASRGRRLVLVPKRPLPRGAYRVRWRSVSTEDGHPLEGSFGFGVRTAPVAGGDRVEEGPLAGSGWARAVSRALLYAALLLFAGALFVRALLGAGWPAYRRPPGEAPKAGPRDSAAGSLGSVAREEARRRADALVLDAGLATASLAAAAAIVDASEAAGGLTVRAVGDYLLANFTGVARIALVALALAALALARRAPRAAAVAAIAGLGCVVAAGHANSADPRAVAVLADWTHLVAGAMWLGGAALIVLAWGPGLRDAAVRSEVARDVLPGFGRVALPAFGAVAVAGAVNAMVELGAVSELWRSAYGRVLAVKVALVAAAALAAWTHVRARPLATSGASGERRHWRALRAEVALGGAVVAAAGLLVAFPLPPRQLDAATRAGAVAPACDPCPLPAPRADELAVAEQAGSLVVAAWIRAGGAGPGRPLATVDVRGRPPGLAGTIRTLDVHGRPARGPISVPGGRVRPCGPGCARFAIAAGIGGERGRATEGPPPGATAPLLPVLRVRVRDRGRSHVATLPARWERGASRRARALLERAQRTMRGLRGVREHERTTSGPGTLAVTRYALAAPDRLSLATAHGVRTVQIGRRQWVRLPGEPWRVGPIPGGAPFRTRSWFRWTPYARAVRLLGSRAGVARLAVADPATPAWFRLEIETRTGRVLRERLVAPARRIDHRFFGFNAPVTIEPPRDAVRAG